MYPFARLTYQILKYRKRPLDPWDTHVSRHIVLPWDLDFMRELNNGLTLTLYDAGRIPFVVRSGVWDAFSTADLSLTIAGSSLRYRKRLTLFQSIEQRTRIAGWDDRFIYFDQTFWTDPETCAGQGAFRAAVVRKGKMVDIEAVVIPLIDRHEIRERRPVLPDWMAAWAETEALRPWPPERG